MKFAISTCWNSHRHEDGYAMLVELAELGFEYAELSHGIRLSLVPGILNAVGEGVIKISSLHNFCPLPVGILTAAPNLYEPSALSRRERILWLNNTLRTVDFAARVDCQRIVLHSGRVHFLWRDPETAVENALEATGTQRNEALKLACEKGLRRLRRSSPRFLQNLKQSYTELAERASDKGVKFGIENREGFSELPLDSESLELQTELKELGIFGYWHDAGHARLKEQMGLLDHGKHLKELRPYLVGYHLHDVSDTGRDHRPPGTGTIDWSVFDGMIQEGDCVVLELNPRLEADEVRGGREFLLRSIPALSDA